jgi:hypothetical protein
VRRPVDEDEASHPDDAAALLGNPDVVDVAVDVRGEVVGNLRAVRAYALRRELPAEQLPVEGEAQVEDDR